MGVQAVPTTISVSHRRGAVLIAVRGELGHPTVGRFNNALDVADGEPVYVDLAEATVIDSEGINALLHAHNAGTPLRVTCASRTVTSVLKRAGIYTLFCDNDN